MKIKARCCVLGLFQNLEYFFQSPYARWFVAVQGRKNDDERAGRGADVPANDSVHAGQKRGFGVKKERLPGGGIRSYVVDNE